MSARPVSALVLTFNEDQHVARCLSALVWADEVVVVDARSTDRTREICLQVGAPWAQKLRFLERAWTGFREQREFALAQARHDWVLVVDADECCTPELAQRVRGLLDAPNGPPLRAYKVRRQEYFLGKEIHAGIWNPSYQDRFFHREGVRYVNDVHEYPLFAETPGRLEEPLLHAPDFGSQRFLEKMVKYTGIEARDRVAQGRRTNAFRMLFAFPAMFLKNYFYYGAWRDGREGFVISVLEGISRAVRHVRMWQVQRELAASAPKQSLSARTAPYPRAQDNA